MTQLTATVEVSWEKPNYLQSGTLCIDCDCYWCESLEETTCDRLPFGHGCHWVRDLFTQTYSGGWTIAKSPNGMPEINGGYRSPDFTMTEQEIENHIIPEEYRNKINVKFNYLQDDRVIKANTLDMFF